MEMNSSLTRAARSGVVLIAGVLGACVDRPTPSEPMPNPGVHYAAGDLLLVTSQLDFGPGSIRTVLATVTGGEVIRFDPSLAGTTIAVDTILVVPKNVTIEGPADRGITFNGGHKTLIFKVEEGATLKNMTIADGTNLNNRGTDIGAGILAFGNLVLDHVTITNDPNATSTGPGIRGENVTLINSTITNSSPAIDFDGEIGSVSLVNSTISNSKSFGILPFNTFAIPKRVTMRNSVLANNSPNCFTVSDFFTFEGQNISDDETCTKPAFGLLIVDPLLLDIANNGGPALTQALDPNSPAINAGVDCNQTVDERNVARDAKCDIGAFEFVFTTIDLTIDGGGRVDPKTGSVVLTGTVRCSREELFDLAIHLTQDQRARRGQSTIVEATKQFQVACTTSAQPWIALMTAPSGAVFENGDATVSATTVNIVGNGVTSASVSTAVKLSWAKK